MMEVVRLVEAVFEAVNVTETVTEGDADGVGVLEAVDEGVRVVEEDGFLEMLAAGVEEEEDVTKKASPFPFLQLLSFLSLLSLFTVLLAIGDIFGIIFVLVTSFSNIVFIVVGMDNSEEEEEEEEEEESWSFSFLLIVGSKVVVVIISLSPISS